MSPEGKVTNWANTFPAGGSRLKLTMSAPVPLRNCLRVSSMDFMFVLRNKSQHEPCGQTHRSAPIETSNLLPGRALDRAQDAHMSAAAAKIAGNASLIWASVGLGFLSR